MSEPRMDKSCDGCWGDGYLWTVGKGKVTCVKCKGTGRAVEDGADE